MELVLAQCMWRQQSQLLQIKTIFQPPTASSTLSCKSTRHHYKISSIDFTLLYSNSVYFNFLTLFQHSI